MNQTETTAATFAPIAANYLHLRIGTSRGCETWGYTTVSVTDNGTDKAFRACGGGYDMKGTVVGDWLEAVAQDRLQALAARCGRDDSRAYGCDNKWAPIKGYYGSTINPDGRVTIDGACGLETVRSIAEAVGIRITGNYLPAKRRGSYGKYLGYFVSDSGMPA